MDSIADIYDEVSAYKMSHVYGPISSNKASNLCDYIASRPRDGLTIVCYRSRADAKKGFAAAQGKKKYQLAVDEVEYTTQPRDVIYCTTAKARNIIIDLDHVGKKDLLEYVLIESWDTYDVNAYTVAALLRNCETSVVLLSCSLWSHLVPNDTMKHYAYPCSDIQVKYSRETPLQLSKLIDAKCLLFGDIRGIANPLVESASLPVRDSSASYVIDSAKEDKVKPYTKLVADLRANAIDKGIVYRCIAEALFDKLPANTPNKSTFGLSEVLLFLLTKGYNVSVIFPDKFFPTYQAEIENISAVIKHNAIDERSLGIITRAELSLLPGILKLRWTSQSKSSRDQYISSLVACLIDNAPDTYADVDSYKKFAGRSDLETMCNMWQSLIAARGEPFSTWRGREKYEIDAWCRRNSFNTEPIRKLVSKMKKHVNIFLQHVPLNSVLGNLSVNELNFAKNMLADIYGTVNKKWDVSKTLPTLTARKQLPNVVIPIQFRASLLLMYLRTENIKDVIPAKEENLDDVLNM